MAEVLHFDTFSEQLHYCIFTVESCMQIWQQFYLLQYYIAETFACLDGNNFIVVLASNESFMYYAKFTWDNIWLLRLFNYSVIVVFLPCPIGSNTLRLTDLIIREGGSFSFTDSLNSTFFQVPAYKQIKIWFLECT